MWQILHLLWSTFSTNLSSITSGSKPQTLQLVHSPAPNLNANGIEIYKIVDNFLSRCGMRLESTPFDIEFYNECKQTLLSHYIHPHDSNKVSEPWCKRYLSVGVIITTNAYGHLKDKLTKIYIALYTALATYFDDIFEKNVDHMSGFNERFMKALPQGDMFLDAFAKILLDTPTFFGRLASNIIITSTLDFITSMSVDVLTKGMKFNQNLHRFAIACRNMSGIAYTYAPFIFPKDVPFAIYAQCLPDMQIYINHVNDILSFYKEDKAGETENLASILRQVHPSMTKYQIVQGLASDAAEADLRVRTVLAQYQPALDAYNCFRQGYVSFHASSGRYKLDELFSFVEPEPIV